MSFWHACITCRCRAAQWIFVHRPHSSRFQQRCESALNVYYLTHGNWTLTLSCAGIHLSLSYQEIGDSDISLIKSILQGDCSRIFQPPAALSAGGPSAYALDDDWFLKHRVNTMLTSLDLSGNCISNFGLELIADCLHVSALRFIALKFNPCREMPLLTSDTAWTNMSRTDLSPPEPRVGLTPAPPCQEYAFQNSNASRNSGTGCSRNKLCQRLSELGSAHFTVHATSSCSLPEKISPKVRAAKRFKCNAVHPE